MGWIKVKPQDNELTKEEKLIFLLNRIEKYSEDNSKKEELNDLKRKLILEMNTNKESLNNKEQS